MLWIFIILFHGSVFANYMEEEGIWRLSHVVQDQRVLRLGDGQKNGSFPDVIFAENYSKHRVPYEKGGQPVRVNFSINLNSILAVDEPKQVITLESTIRMRWYDKRITLNNQSDALIMDKRFGPYLLLNRDPVKDIWFPDMFINKAKDVRVPTYKIPPAYLRIYESGLMMYSARVNYDLSCPMQFENYPVDEQECDIIFESWGHTVEHIIFSWLVNDVKISEKITLNQHAFQAALITNTDSHNYSTGTFSSVTMRLYLTRKLTYHLMRTYLPSFLFVMVAWFSMFVPLNHVPGRVTMSMTTLLTLSSMFNALTTITPPISYVTKLDIWMVCCIAFVFATLLEFTIVIFLKYYLRHLPTFHFKQQNSNETTRNNSKSIFEIKSQIQAWLKNENASRDNLVQVLKVQPRKEPFSRHQPRNIRQNHIDDTDDDASDSEEEQANVKARDEAGERIIKKIEKWSVIVYIVIFIIFLIIYIWDLLKDYIWTVESGLIIPQKKISD